ncbi:MAG: hypothetical protein U0269_20890 [Polyangiales bacterium]
MHTPRVRRSLGLFVVHCALIACRPGEATSSNNAVSRANADNSGSSRPIAVAHADAAQAAADAAAPASVPDAISRARTRAASVEVTPAAIAAWFPQRLVATVERVAHGLPAPSAPQFNNDVVLWFVALPPAETTLSADQREAVCNEVQRQEARIVCESDAADIRGVSRARWVFAWRTDGAPPRPNLATPLRALTHVGDALCVRSFERTMHTVEIAVTSRDLAALGRALALATNGPRMSELVLVRAENRGTEVRAELSWPTDRADRSTGELEGDAWPARCDGASHVLQDDATSLRALFALRGTVARGAVVERASRQWVVTVGDRVGDAEIVAINDQSLRVRRAVRGRPREFDLRWEGSGPEAPTDHRPPILLPSDPARGLPQNVRR